MVKFAFRPSLPKLDRGQEIPNSAPIFDTNRLCRIIAPSLGNLGRWI